MFYSIPELIFFLFFYAIAGWAVQVAISSFLTGRFVNTGLLNGPFSCSSGFCVTLMALLSAEYATDYLGQFILGFLVISIVTTGSGYFAEHAIGKKLWDYSGERYLAFSGWRGLVRTAVLSLSALLTVMLIHPFLYLLVQLMPIPLLVGIDLLLVILFLCDLIATLWALRAIKHRHPIALNVSASLQDTRMTLGSRVFTWIRRRIWTAFPEMEQSPNDGTGFGHPHEDRIFARGVGFYKIFWMFFLCALFGDWIETVYVYLVHGILMSRSSLLYGTFSVVWGLGGVLFTIILEPLRHRNDRVVFLGGFFLGGAYEYLCSVFTEIVFGTVFWDYSDMPFNIQGRTNLLFMFFWGILALVWVKFIYPPLSKGIEKIPPVVGTVTTWCLIIFMVANTLLSGLAMLRYTARGAGVEPTTMAEEFLDRQYPDHLVEFVWPNMKIVD